MKTLKCKNCDGMIEWRNGDGETTYAYDGLSLTIGCPSCRQNIVYGLGEVVQFAVYEPTHDTVNHPSHYNKYEREVIDSIRGLCTADEYRGYLKGNQIKYLARYQDKNGLEDLRKHRWYVDALIEFEEGRE